MPQSPFVRLGGLLALAATVACNSGCGGGTKAYPVHGKVTYKGQAITTGTLNFVAEDKNPNAFGEIHKDGTYTLTTFAPNDGAVPGKYHVMIYSAQPGGGGGGGGNAQPGGNPKPGEDPKPDAPPRIPSKYTSSATSTLTATVEAKDNTIDLILED